MGASILNVRYVPGILNEDAAEVDGFVRVEAPVDPGSQARGGKLLGQGARHGDGEAE
jgi:hypothetical protein